MKKTYVTPRMSTIACMTVCSLCIGSAIAGEDVPEMGTDAPRNPNTGNFWDF